MIRKTVSRVKVSPRGSGPPGRRGRRTPTRSIRALYRTPVQATRAGALYNAFPYPTKISPESIALFIAAHTRPGETVLDPFAGSGTTGLAAMLCANPSQQLRDMAASLDLDIEWGARRAILFEIGVLGAFVSRVLTTPPDPDRFVEVAQQILSKTEQELGWIYDTVDPSGRQGTIRYVIWTEQLRCPSCSARITFWDACVKRQPARIAPAFRCPKCCHTARLDQVERVRTKEADPLLRATRVTRLRQPAWIYGQTEGRYWNRPARSSDLKHVGKISQERLPSTTPKVPIPWGDLYRSGYHDGISHAHHFYTHRNLLALAALWRGVESAPSDLRDALRFWILSYNASHATLMTRVVAKAGHDDLVVTSAQPGVLYISSLPVEKNVFDGLRRKLQTISASFRLTRQYAGLVEVHQASSISTGLRRASVDYVFTDPPFGGNIPYAEVNFLNEVWLGRVTDPREEVIVSPHQEKTIDDYGALLTRVFTEAYRVLRSKGAMTVVFHSTSAAVWNRLRDAWTKGGFKIVATSVLAKTQASFKQVTTDGHVKGDPLLLLEKGSQDERRRTPSVALVVERLLKRAIASNDPEELKPQRLYSRLVSYYLERRQEVPIGAREFYRRFAV